MPQQEEKVQPNKEETKEKVVESLLNYECEDNDDGTDWETQGLATIVTMNRIKVSEIQ